jgi:hypothetical protein
MKLTARLRAAVPRRGSRAAWRDQVAAVRREAGAGLAARFTCYAEWLAAEGYVFRSLGIEPPDLSQSFVYLRYDTGPDGFAAAWLLAELHERHRLPGTFTLAWDLIAADPGLVAGFAALRRFDARYVRFGLNCAPVDNVLSARRFGGIGRRQNDFIDSPAFSAFLERLAADDPAVELAALRADAAARLRTEAAAFADAFGRWPTLAARSGAWSAGFARLRVGRAALATLDDTFRPVRFLASLDLGELGFGPEAAALPGDEMIGPHLVFGGGDPEIVRRDHHQRVWSGGGFVAIFPPAAWLRASFDALTEPVPVPDPEITDPEMPAPAAAAPTTTPILTNLADLVPFGRRCERLDCRALAEAAQQRIGPRLEPLFHRFVDWLSGEGYVFSDLEQVPPVFDKRRVYLRYDVHIQDLLSAYVLAGLHERLGIPGSFQLTWRFTSAEEQLAPFFRKFLEFDRGCVQVGLHCAPAATAYIQNHCRGDYALAQRAVSEPAFENHLRGLLAAHRRHGDDAPELAALRATTDAAMTTLADGFHQAFGDWKTVSGHGNFLTNAFERTRAREPELSALRDYFNPVGYLQRFGVGRFGFDRELSVFADRRPDLPCVIMEAHPAAVLRRRFHGRVAEGLGFLCLFHPATLTTDHLASIIPSRA